MHDPSAKSRRLSRPVGHLSRGAPPPHRANTARGGDPRRRGFTLIELIIVISIVGILLGVAVPVYNIHLRHAHEAALKQDLHTIREAIDQYTQDKNKAPQSLEDIVTAGYLAKIPVDPFTHSADTWQLVNEDVLTALDQTQPGITDVHSGSDTMSTEGTAYSSW